MDEEAIARAVAKGNARSESKTMAYKFACFWLLILALVIGWVGSVLFGGFTGGLITGMVVFFGLGIPLHRWWQGD